jgi:CMP-N,N'-diacetyllegionaminic acid synthase
MKIIAIIPARSGSKGIPDKNIKLYKEKPLLAHSILQALQSKHITEVYVSTDSIQYKEIALQYGALVPFLRPSEFSDDLSPDIDLFKHFLEYYQENNNETYPDIIVQLRPTYPNRTVELLDNCIETFINNYDSYDSLRTVIPLNKSPYKMYYIGEQNLLIPYLLTYKDIIEPYNQARQLLPQTYLHNGCIDIIKSHTIINKNLLSGNNIYPFVMDENENNDIDTEEDLINSEKKNI